MTLPAFAASDTTCLPDSICPAWTARYDESSLYDHAVDVATSADGSRVYVVGSSTSTQGASDIVTIAYASDTGAELWSARYDGPAQGADTAAALGLSADGSTVFVTGHSAQGGGINSYVTLAYRALDGARSWVTRYTTPQDSKAVSIAVSRDGQRAYVTGYSALELAPNGALQYDFATVAYDAATGAQIWDARYDGPARFWDIATSLGVSTVRLPDGSTREQVFATGRSNGASASNVAADFATVAYDGLTGTQVWAARYNGPANDRDLAYSLGVSPDGAAVFVTGESVGVGTGSDYATVAYDAATGAQRWVARYVNVDLDIALGLAVSPAGDKVAVTGFSVNRVAGFGIAFVRDAATVVYDSLSGQQAWVDRHSEPDGAATSNVQFSGDGRRLYVAGIQNGNVIAAGATQVGHAPALTVAYDAAGGTEIWATHYSGPVGDEGNSAVAVSPDGRFVYVVGGGQSQGADAVTIAYPTGEGDPAPVVPEAPAVVLLPLAALGALGVWMRRRRVCASPV